MLEQRLSKALLKTVLIGDMQVGKTTMMKIEAKKKVSPHERKTIGIDFESVNTEKGNALQIWDTAGDELYSTHSQRYFKGTDAFILVVDGTKLLANAIPPHIQRSLNAAKENSPNAKFYIAVNQWEKLDNSEEAKAKIVGDMASALERKSNFTLLSEESRDALLNAPVFLTSTTVSWTSATIGENINELFDRVEKDYIEEHRLELLKTPKASHPEIVTPPEQPPLPTRTKVWIGGDILLVASLAIFIGASVATGGVLPAVMIGVSVTLGVAFVAWNIGCKLYDNYRKYNEPREKLREMIKASKGEHNNSSEFRFESELASSFVIDDPHPHEQPEVKKPSKPDNKPEIPPTDPELRSDPVFTPGPAAETPTPASQLNLTGETGASPQPDDSGGSSSLDTASSDKKTPPL